MRIIPTNIFSCCAFALTPASPTIPIANPADCVISKLPTSWSHSKVQRRDVRMRTYHYNDRGWLHKKGCTFLYDDDSNDHTIDTQDTRHDHRHNWLHYEFGLEHSHRTDAHSCFGTSVSCAQVREDECRGDSKVAEEVLWAIFSLAAHGWVDLINNTIVRKPNITKITRQERGKFICIEY